MGYGNQSTNQPSTPRDMRPAERIMSRAASTAGGAEDLGLVNPMYPKSCHIPLLNCNSSQISIIHSDEVSCLNV